MSGEHVLLLTAGAAPILAAKPRYYADPEFRGLFTEAGMRR
uniref:Protein of unassigned function n=1 Tax=Methylobacterium oryzae CBMB20 TaxID=693986 RepID=A0A088B2I1_9HYPH|nr:protein of unassigned function [Methylobacterium oryzae CBMB20]